MARIKVFDKTTQTWVYADKSFGKDGSSVTVANVTESTVDGGSNIVTFSDGKTVTIKNGSKGSTGATGPTGPAGKTPIKGTDYWTEADQEAIVQQVITALGTPVFGRVDADKRITLTVDRLADGTYELGYEDEDGNWVKICDYEKTSEPEPSYTNILDDAEVVLNKRWSKSKAQYEDAVGIVTFDLPWIFNFSLTSTDIIRMKGFPAIMKNSAGTSCNWLWYDADSNYLDISFTYANDGETGYYGNNIWGSNYTDEGNGVYNYAFSHKNLNAAYGKRNQIAFIRVSMILKDGAAVTEEDVENLIITYNEPIV